MASLSSRPLTDRKLWLLGGLGFASGLPLALTGFTLRQWLTENGLSLQLIGLTALIGLSYTLKFLWAPLFDQAAPPPVRRLGRRRGWLLVLQGLLTSACVLLALGDPALRPVALVGVASAVAFLSACQDIVIDGWRIESFDEGRQGTALAFYVWGYRVAMLVSGSGAIWMAGRLGWHGALLLMAGLSLVGPAVTLCVPEPAGLPAVSGSVGGRARLVAAVVAPLRDLLARPRAVEVLAFVLLFYLGEALAQTMAVPFYRSLGYDRAQVAVSNGLPSLAATLAGAAFGGWLVRRIGTGRALISTGFVQMATMLLYIMLAWSHGAVAVLYAKVTLESFAEAMAAASFLTYLSSLCSRQFPATQYALLSSLAALAVHTIGGFSGYLAHWLGWVGFYTVALLAALPAMLIMLDLIGRPAVHCRHVNAA